MGVPETVGCGVEIAFYSVSERIDPIRLPGRQTEALSIQATDVKKCGVRLVVSRNA